MEVRPPHRPTDIDVHQCALPSHWLVGRPSGRWYGTLSKRRQRSPTPCRIARYISAAVYYIRYIRRLTDGSEYRSLVHSLLARLLRHTLSRSGNHLLPHLRLPRLLSTLVCAHASRIFSAAGSAKLTSSMASVMSLTLSHELCNHHDQVALLPHAGIGRQTGGRRI